VSKNANEFVVIVHPDVETEGTCTRKAFTTIWESKGWSIKTADEPEEEPEEEPMLFKMEQTSLDT